MSTESSNSSNIGSSRNPLHHPDNDSSNSTTATTWQEWLALQEERRHDLPRPSAPSAATMERRWDFRQAIQTQTRQHRRIHPHGGLAGTTRNVLFSLRDRECRAARYCVLHQHQHYREQQDSLPTVNATTTATTRDNKNDIGLAAQQPSPPPPPPRDEEKEEKVDGTNDLSRALTPDSNYHSNDTASPMPGMPGPHDENRKPNDVRVCYPTRVQHELRIFAEYTSVVRYHSAFLDHLGGQDVLDESGRPPSSSSAVSTISIAFSPDALTMASTHGDHTVKITSCGSGRLLQTLVGHPRTPWTVKYHPIDPNIVASGCLDYQVRVWNWKENTCLHMIRFEYAIISLSFHPTGHILAIASGPKLHFWDYDNYGGKSKAAGRGHTNGSSGASSSRGAILDVEQRHMLRCVHFPPDGHTIIVGGMNPNHEERQRSSARGSGAATSFYLRLWDFDFHSALYPSQDNPNVHRGRVILYRKPLSNPRTIVPRALLYNDGGFDVSPDGKVLCACAEYWLPTNVDNAMTLLRKEQLEFEERQEGDNMNAVEAERPESTGTEEGNSNGQNSRNSGLSDGLAISAHSNRGDSESPALVTPTASATTPSPMNRPTQAPTYLSPPRGRTGPIPPAPGPPRGSALRGAGIPSWVLRAAAARALQPDTAGNPPSQPPNDSIPLTPPNPTRSRLPLSPPSPPGRRWAGGLGQRQQRLVNIVNNPSTTATNGTTTANNNNNSDASDNVNNCAGSGDGRQPPAQEITPQMRVSEPTTNATTTTTTTTTTTSTTASTTTTTTTTTGFSETTPAAMTTRARNQTNSNQTPPPPPPPPPPGPTPILPQRPLHPLSLVSSEANSEQITRQPGRYVPHVVTISLDTTPIALKELLPPHKRHVTSVANGYQPRLGQLLEACPLDASKASAITCVKFSPSADFCLLGYGVREPITDASGEDTNYHPVSALYRVRGGMTHVSTMLSTDDDVNIARFHPASGYGFVYGTKQGRVRVLSPRPWNYYGE